MIIQDDDRIIHTGMFSKKAKEVIDSDYVERMSKVIKSVTYSSYTPINVELNNVFKNFGK